MPFIKVSLFKVFLFYYKPLFALLPQKDILLFIEGKSGSSMTSTLRQAEYRQNTANLKK